MSRLLLLLGFVLLVLVEIDVATAGDAPGADAARGYRNILDTPYLPATLDAEVFDNLWQAWPESQRAAAEKADAESRRAQIYARYGFTPRPDEPDGPPLQLTRTKQGYHMNCFTCHGGEVAGRVHLGLGNTNLALQSFVEDVAKVRRILKRPLTRADLASAMIPHGDTVGTTNAVVFSIVLLQFRDQDLNVVPPRRRLRLPHHDLDAPPWWHYKHRTHLYIDGTAKVGHRALMPFILVPTNTPEKVRGFEDDFRHIEAYLKTVEAPRYPYPIDRALAQQGKPVFDKNCASCHGTYGEGGRYPNRLVPMEKLGTDRARLDALRVEDRKTYANSWLTGYDPEGVRTDPRGYVAPPLHGIWASAPYLHNGSVPTLWHLLRSEQRPRVWRREPKGYDKARVGLVIEAVNAVPETSTKHGKRQWFDTTAHGKSAAGHTFPDKLSEEEKRALLEYLKTL